MDQKSDVVIKINNGHGQDPSFGGNLNPICKQIDCGSPGNLPNGYLEGTKTSLGNMITFRCFDETTFVGVSNSTICTESGKWSNPLPSCLAPCVVPLIENGRIDSAAAGSKLPHGATIEAICKPQYESAVSNTTISQCNNGTWTVIPFCVPGKSLSRLEYLSKEIVRNIFRSCNTEVRKSLRE